MSDTGGGRSHFVAQHDLWDEKQQIAAREVERRLRDSDIEIVRFSFPDQHGLLRGKALTIDAARQALQNGVNIVTTVVAKDTAHNTV